MSSLKKTKTKLLITDKTNTNTISSDNAKPKLVKKTLKLKSKNLINKKQNSDKSLNSISVPDIKTETDLDLIKYKPLINRNRVHPKYWELPNRKHFYNWINEEFKQYDSGDIRKHKKEIPRIPKQVELNDIQRLTRDYLQGESPVRGLLLFIGLGAGKTCASIAISESILTKKEVIILSKANLEDNFKKEIRVCGSDYVKSINNWVFSDCKTKKEKEFAIELGIPEESIIENKGAFFVDFTKHTSNYDELTPLKKEQLNKQIEYIIDKRFNFIHFDSSTLWKHMKDDEFDNKIVIVDEVHNIGNTMASQVNPNALKYYNLFMNAKNPKYIFLSGTPIINQIYEITKIYNILRGYMNVLEIKINVNFNIGIKIDYSNIKYMLKKNNNVDQIIINETQKLIKITKNPDNFVTHPDGKGIIYKPDESVSFEVFKEEVTKIIQNLGYKFRIDEKKETCFPEDKKEFEKQFYNPELNKLKRIDLIKRRITGLTSYYGYQDKQLYPELLPINYISVPMSEYQFSNYERYRHQEIEEDKFNKKKKDNDEQKDSSSYRIKSRLACSFVFPKETGSPYDAENFEDKIRIIETLSEELDEFDLTADNAAEIKKKELDKQIKDAYLKLLYQDKEKYLDLNNGSLALYSPKYYAMIKNILKEKDGKIFVYSNFKTLIGLNSFSYALIQTGKWAEFRIKKVKGSVSSKKFHWEIDETEDEKGKQKFIFYTGSEKAEVRDIYRNIYNSQWNNMDSSCDILVKQLKEINDNNYYGEIIKMLMTTKTGAEGLDLKEVRYIHIMEPYWQPVLIEQIIGRGVRNGSHLTLAPKYRNVEIFIYMSTIPPNLIKKISYIDVRNDVYKYPNPALPNKAFKVVTSDEHLFMTAERKKLIINEFQKLMKETAFDCSLNYSKNMLNPDNKGLICMDYNTKNRDEYLFTPSIDDTTENIDLAQEKIVVEQYKEVKIKDTSYYYFTTPNSEGKIYLYNVNLSERVRLPKPVGEVKIINGQNKFAFYKKKSKK